MYSAVVSGITSGAAYGLIALGLVLIYKTSRTFNLAQGEFGTVAVYAAFVLSSRSGLPYWAVFVAALLVGMAFGLLVERLVVWPMRGATRVAVLVATSSIATGVIAAETFIGGNLTQVLPSVVPSGFMSLGSFAINSTQVVIIASLLVVAIAGAVFFSKTVLGAAVLAASQDLRGARAIGLPVDQISMFAWGTAGLLGACAALLLAPLESFGPGFLTANGLIEGLAAAVIGGMSSLSGAVVGGLVVGLGESLTYTYLGSQIPGASSVAIFVILLIALSWRRAESTMGWKTFFERIRLRERARKGTTVG
jgi:branched-chain amino acid transport system permease protein